MRTPPQSIPGFAEPISAEVNMWSGRRTLFLGADEVPTKRGKATLTDAAGAAVPAQIVANLFIVNPKLKVGDQTYPTGEEPASWLKVLALAPFLMVAGGILGAILGVGAVISSQAVLRSHKSMGAKAGLVILFAAAAFGLYVLAVVALYNAG